MKLNQEIHLTQEDARRLVDRAIDKSEEIKQTGAWVAVDEGGVVMSASRMDGTGGFALPLCRAKAYSAAVNREPSADIYARTHNRFMGIYDGYQGVARDRMFPGQGALPIERDGIIIGGLSTGAGIGPFLKFDGVEPEKMIVDGQPTNAEDLIICYALETEYRPQHGDDLKRWMDAYGKAPEEFGRGTGFDPAPPAKGQVMRDAAVALADAALIEARLRGVTIAVAVTDRLGDAIQLDRMYGASPMSPDIADAVAVTAINFQGPSGEAGLATAAAEIAALIPFKTLPLAGGIPIYEDGIIVGAVGVSGASPQVNEEIARVAIG